MKCTNCSFDNLPHSKFCQECGLPLSKKSSEEPKSQEKSLRQEIEKIDDVIFHPKKKGSFIGNVIKLFLIIGGIGFVGLVGLIILGLLYLKKSTTTKTTTNPIETNLITFPFPIMYLEIKDLDSEWIGHQFYVKGILKNSYSSPAKNVKVRIDFYKDKNQQQLFDTRYISLPGVAANGAYSFYKPVYINLYYDQFWYVAYVESAEYLK